MWLEKGMSFLDDLIYGQQFQYSCVGTKIARASVSSQTGSHSWLWITHTRSRFLTRAEPTAAQHKTPGEQHSLYVGSPPT